MSTVPEIEAAMAQERQIPAESALRRWCRGVFVKSSFADASAMRDRPVTMSYKSVTLAEALSGLFDALELTCVERDGELLIRPAPLLGANPSP